MSRIRVTGLCFNDRDEILVLRQEVNGRHFALPGGGVEDGETLESALKREFREETGLEVAVDKIIYVSEYDRTDAVHVVEVAMTVRAVGGGLVTSQSQNESSPIEAALFVPKHMLHEYLSREDIVTAIQHAVDSPGRYIGMRQA